jgi:Zn-dependent M16 (insulinase) family peptidase
MGALRVLDVDTIRAYHKNYYVPHNLCLIVAGGLSTQALLDTLQNQVEPQIIQHGQAHGPRPDGWKRPFIETESSVKPEMKGVRKELAEFPEKDESTGELAMYLLGPSPNDHLTLKVRCMMYHQNQAN